MISSPTQEIVDKLTTVKYERSKTWVKDLFKLYESYGDMQICGTITSISKTK